MILMVVSFRSFVGGRESNPNTASTRGPPEPTYSSSMRVMSMFDAFTVWRVIEPPLP